MCLQCNWSDLWTSYLFIYDRMGVIGRGVRGDNCGQIWLPGVSVSVVHRRRSLFLSFSTYYLGVLGLEEAINCILARTSRQRTTYEKRTKALLPKCPLFGGSTADVFRKKNSIPHSMRLETQTHTRNACGPGYSLRLPYTYAKCMPIWDPRSRVLVSLVPGSTEYSLTHLPILP